MIAVRDFPSHFERDLFAQRRGGTQGKTNEHNETGFFFTAGNPYDPESLFVGSELEAGLTGPRNWPDEATYQQSVRGELPTWVVLAVAPRTKPLQEPYPICTDGLSYPFECYNSLEDRRWRDELIAWRAARGHDQA